MLGCFRYCWIRSPTTFQTPGVILFGVGRFPVVEVISLSCCLGLDTIEIIKAAVLSVINTVHPWFILYTC